MNEKSTGATVDRTLETFTLPKGRVITINGAPAFLKADVQIETHPANWTRMNEPASTTANLDPHVAVPARTTGSER